MGSDGLLILVLRMRVSGCFPVEHNPAAQGELDVRELFRGVSCVLMDQSRSELLSSPSLSNHPSSPPPQLNRPGIYAAAFYSSKLFLVFVGTDHRPQTHKKEQLRICFLLKIFHLIDVIANVLFSEVFRANHATILRELKCLV